MGLISECYLNTRLENQLSHVKCHVIGLFKMWTLKRSVFECFQFWASNIQIFNVCDYNYNNYNFNFHF